MPKAVAKKALTAKKPVSNSSAKPQSKAQNLVSYSELCKFIGITMPTVTAYIDKGMPVVTKPVRGRAGEIDTVAVVDWIRQEASGNESPLFISRVKLSQEQHKKIAMENALKSGETISVESARAASATLHSTFKTLLLGKANRDAKGDNLIRMNLISYAKEICEEIFAELEDVITKRR